jgi:hypothetical protein
MGGEFSWGENDFAVWLSKGAFQRPNKLLNAGSEKKQPSAAKAEFNTWQLCTA